MSKDVKSIWMYTAIICRPINSIMIKQCDVLNLWMFNLPSVARKIFLKKIVNFAIFPFWWGWDRPSTPPPPWWHHWLSSQLYIPCNTIFHILWLQSWISSNWCGALELVCTRHGAFSYTESIVQIWTMGMLDICDEIKQNESELANTDFKI